MPGSSAPIVAPAVHAMFRDALPAGTSLYLGPPKGDLPDRYVAVMYAGDDRPGVQGFGRPNQMANYTDADAEEFLLWCTISAATGDQDAIATMALTNELFALCVAALKADRHCRETVVAPGFAALDNYEWQAERDGDIVTVFFAIKVRQEWFT